MGVKWAFQVILGVLIIGIIGTNSAFALPITIEFDSGGCDGLNVPLDLHELGFPPTVIPPGVFPIDEEIAASHIETDLTACSPDDVNTPNYLVTMTNNSPHDFIEVWWVGDSLLTVGNSDGTIGQPGFGALPGDAFRIDNVGLNTPLQFESMTSDLIFEAGETWQFIVQDFNDLFNLANTGPSSFRSAGIGGVSSPSPADLSRASIIAFTEDEIFGSPVGGKLFPIDTTALLLAGIQTNALWIMSALAIIGSVAFGAVYITVKKN